ncbi:phosphatase PAP2 family protein [Bacillus sp. FJAT-49705]|uniref:Phosphatase PAP2 family protein n=1 Tax=Cytobacillus citreus TaxID=2833586 RepID=A0ABS5NQ54_9BACI|nr:phosphatase PAP2 family protein [Cytobacillus citreus]MBS4189935.1 phosphatase PAP2 family protein [Cytobacillus citreus]
MMRKLHFLYDYECRLFNKVNRYFHKKWLNLFFRRITHIGGATVLITTLLLLMFILNGQSRMTAVSSAVALAISHLPVHIVKKMYPRKRPYMILANAHYPSNPLQDHSFPSGHTTAIFSVVIPFVLYIPILAFVLLPLAFIVGLSRIYLGLHYPSDVIAGGILGASLGSLCFLVLHV